MRARIATAFALAFLLAGCTGSPAPDGASATATTDPGASQAPQGPDAGTPASHGEPERTESEVTVRQEGAQFVARRNVTVANDFGGAARATVSFESRNGGVDARAWQQGGYLFQARLEGRGATEQEARDALATLRVEHADDLEAGTLTLSLTVRFEDATSGLPLPVPVPVGSNVQRSASITAMLPPEPALELTVSTSNGAIDVAGLHGPRLELSSSNGRIGAAGAWDEAEVSTSNGAIDLEGVFNGLRAGTSNGRIEGSVESLRSGTHSLGTSNGRIDWKAKAGDAHGFAVSASTSNGDVTVDLPGLRCDGQASCSGQTAGYGGKAIQVDLDLGTSNGDITVTAA